MICPWAGQDAICPSKMGPERGDFRVLFRQWTHPGVVNSTSTQTKLTVWSTNVASFRYPELHILVWLRGVSCRPAARTPWTAYIGKADSTLSRSCSEVAPLTAVAKSYLGMHKLDNICSSSMYDLCVWFVPKRGKMPHARLKRVPKRAIFGDFFANERPLVSSIRHGWKRI